MCTLWGDQTVFFANSFAKMAPFYGFLFKCILVCLTDGVFFFFSFVSRTIPSAWFLTLSISASTHSFILKDGIKSSTKMPSMFT